MRKVLNLDGPPVIFLGLSEEQVRELARLIQPSSGAQPLRDMQLLLDALTPFARAADYIPEQVASKSQPLVALRRNPKNVSLKPLETFLPATNGDLYYAKAVLEIFGAAMADRPRVVCLCGSTRFSEAFQQANLTETLAGRIVLTIGCDMRSDDGLFADKTPEELRAIKARLDVLHQRKIDLADEVLILNVGGYIGDSTRSELHYAFTTGKHIRFLEEPSPELVAWLASDSTTRLREDGSWHLVHVDEDKS